METSTQTALVHAAQAGDSTAFEMLVEPYQRELLVHCYRMLGSLHDAEDQVQETLIRAWEKCATFTNPGSFRAWLYRIATNLCLNTLTRTPRRSLPQRTHAAADPTAPLLTRQREPIWLEPFPDDLLADQHIEPEYHALQREHTTLAFLIALQQLTPTQRAILLLRDVLDWPAHEVAEWLETSVPAVNSGLQRARRALRQLHIFPESPFELESPPLQTLLERYVTLWEQADIPGLVALLQEDAWFSMPPNPGWYQGRADIATFLRTVVFSGPRRWRLLTTRANGSPAFAMYLRQPGESVHQLFGLLVLDMVGERIAGMVAFLEVASLAPFSLPSTLTP